MRSATRGPTPRPRIWAIALAVAAVAVAGSCSRASEAEPAEPTSPAASSDEWRVEADRLCEALSEQYVDLGDAQLTDRASALAHIERMTAFAADAAAAASPLKDSSEPEATALASRLTELHEATLALATAAQDGDATAVDARVAEIGAIGDQINAAATTLGLGSCGGF